MSTFLVECDAATWQAYGFENKTIEQSQAICEQIFAATLDGHPLISNKSVWRNFPWIWNENWSHGNMVLIGDALHSAHFSIGSGTRLAIEDAIALTKALEAETAIPAGLARYQAERKPIVKKLVTAARTSADWYEHFPEHMKLDLMDFGYSYITRSGRIDDARLRAMSPAFMARYEAAKKIGSRIMTHDIADQVPRDNPGAREIGFAIPESYNASRILFDNLAHGRGERLALTGPGGTRTYAQLCAEASQWGHGFQSLGLKRGDRILMFLDDTPAYPAAFFGAVRSGFVPLLINTLTPPDLLQFYLSDAGAAVAVAEAEFAPRFNAEACKDTPLQTLIVVNGAAGEHAVPNSLDRGTMAARISPPICRKPTPRRDEMAFWMYSSGSTGRPKGIVHLQHDMAYSEQAFARSVLKLGPDDICFSVPKIFFAYGFGNAITFPFSVGAATLLLPGQPKPATIFEAIENISPIRVLRIADALYLADQGRRRVGHRFLVAAHGAVGRRGAVGGSLQRLEGADGARDHRGARLHRSPAHLSLQPPREEEARRGRPARARL